LDPSIEIDFTVDDLSGMYRTMRTITSTSERAAGEVQKGKLQSAFYPVRGLEGVCAALGAVMHANDQMVSTYRNLGDAVAKGASLRRIMAEIYGRVDGVSKGKGGAMHIHDQSVGLVTTTGVVGSGLPIAVGLGIALHLDGEGRAVVVTFGDGATSIGAFHEAMNMAALCKPPVVFVCQNNQWAEHTPIAEYAASTDLAGRAASYGMRSVRVDGFDPVATAVELRGALEHARRGDGPSFVECVTYRLTGHSGSADYSYVPKAELEAALARDPAPTFRQWLLDRGVLNDEEITSIDSEVDALVEDAFAFAEAGSPPDVDERFDDVFEDRSLVDAL
jgi:pyruvate dehydrogenase E1 component alpha subunit